MVDFLVDERVSGELTLSQTRVLGCLATHVTHSDVTVTSGGARENCELRRSFGDLYRACADTS